MGNEIRCLSLDEWFLCSQLEKINHGFHLPMQIEIDITPFIIEYKNKNKKPPITALLIKASSQLIKQFPEYNKVYFNTTFGRKIVTPAYNSVNVPIELSLNGKQVISATTIKDAYLKSYEEINSELKNEKNKTLDQLPVNKLIHGKGLRFIRKLKLRIILFLFLNCPSLYVKNKGGGISVSSLFTGNPENKNIDVVAYGMTTLTLCSATVLENDNRYLLKIGIGFNHIVTHGINAPKGISQLATIINKLVEK
jgi:hypothetical protein